MRAKLICALFASVVAFIVYAGPGSVEPFVWTSVSTNVAASASGDVKTNDTFVTDWVDAIVLDIGGYASPTCTVNVITAGGNGTAYSRSLLATFTVTADGTYYVSELADTTAGVDITGAARRIPLLQDKVVVQAYAANTNAVTLKVVVITSPTP